MPDVTGFKAIVPKKRMVIRCGWAPPDPKDDDPYVQVALLEVLSILVNLRDGSVDYVVRDVINCLNESAEGDYYRFHLWRRNHRGPYFVFDYIQDAWYPMDDNSQMNAWQSKMACEFRSKAGKKLGVPPWPKAIMANVQAREEQKKREQDEEERLRQDRLERIRRRADNAKPAEASPEF